MHPLTNPIKCYDWGHAALIPDFLGVPHRSGQPVAEAWMGTHPGGPSQTSTPEGPKDLRDLTAQGLPYLMKLLAAAKALSIQAHPNLTQARDGFRQENERGVPLADPRRNYKDPNHKPEVITALFAPFFGLAGFRATEAIRADFLTLRGLAAGPLPLLDALDAALARGGLQALTHAALDADHMAWRPQEAILLDAASRWDSERAPWLAKLAMSHPGDPGILFLLILNLFRLEPGEALFTPAGCLHAYLEGFGLELMAASDNVLRGGLTTKAIDKDELERIVVFEARAPHILRPETSASDEAVFTPPVPDFRLGCLKGLNQTFRLGPATRPWILLVTEGRVTLRQGADVLELAKGQSAVILPAGTDSSQFQAPSQPDVTATVQGVAYRAWSDL